MRLLLCWLCAFAILLSVSQALSINIDCSLPENAKKCRARKGTPVLPGSKQYANQVLELTKMSDQFLKSMSNRLKEDAESTQAEQLFVNGLMSATQDEIKFVMEKLITLSEGFVGRCYVLAQYMRANATEMILKSGGTTENAKQNEYITQQQKLLVIIEKLQNMRDEIERSYLDAPTSNIHHQSHLLQLKIESVLRRVRNAEEDDVDLHGSAIALLETATSMSAAEKAVRVLDEVLELFRLLRTSLRGDMDQGRDRDEADTETNQATIDFLLSSVHFLHAEAMKSLQHVRKLRAYLRHLTASQYRTFQWSQSVRGRVKATVEMIDATNRLVSDSQPLLDELVHYLKEGDVPFNRTMNPAIDCSTRTDVCGVCGGSNMTCSGCDGVVLSSAVFDVCGKCELLASAGSSCNVFCDGVVNSGKVNDTCGVCGGDDTSCMGCDNVINSGMFYDRCGVCDGDGMSCEKGIECRNVDCPVVEVKCPLGSIVSPDGYKKCCFDPSTDCLQFNAAAASSSSVV